MSATVTSTTEVIAPMLVFERASSSPDTVAMRVLESGVWVEYTWSDVARTVARVADVLRRGGVESGSEVALVSGSRAEWALCVWAINSLGATAIAVSSQADDEVVRAVAERKPTLWVLEGIEACDRAARTDTNGSPVLILDPVEDRWERTKPWVWRNDVVGVDPDADPDRLGRARAGAAAVDAVGPALVLPEGTDRPLSHRDLVSAEAGVSMEPGDEYLAFLPPTWAAEARVLIGGHATSGATVSSGSRVGGGLAELATVAPTVLQAPVEWWDALVDRVTRAATEPGPLAAGAVRRIVAGESGGGLLTKIARASIRRSVGVGRVRDARTLGPVGDAVVGLCAGLEIPLGPELERPASLAGRVTGERNVPATEPHHREEAS